MTLFFGLEPGASLETAVLTDEISGTTNVPFDAARRFDQYMHGFLRALADRSTTLGAAQC